MSTVAQHLTALVRTAAVAAGHTDAPVPLDPCVPTNNPDHGDYQSNFAFRLGKALRTNPRQVATDIVAKVPNDPAVAEATVAGPGFINFRLDDAWLAADVGARATDPRLGADRPGEGRTVVIDYSSPNIAKRMHVGHIRSTLIGAALVRLYRFAGWTVVGDNHIGDWGTQFGALMVGWRRWRDDPAYAEDPVGELQRLYQAYRAAEESDPELAELARAETAKLQSGDPENLGLWQQFVDVSMEEFNGVYARLGIEFDVMHGESFYRERLQPLIDELLERGIAERSEGAVVVPFTAEDGKGLADSPLLIRKSDGAALYGTTDLATIEHRANTWSPELVLYMVDTRQQQHFKQIFAAANKMGLTHAKLVHAWFGMLKFPGGAIAATRKGGGVNLVDVLDSARDKAFAVVTEKNPDLPKDERMTIAEAVGVGAISYFDLSQNPQSDITFDWERVLALDSGSAVYLMYQHARLRRILDKSGLAGQVPPGTPRVAHPSERTMAVLVARTPEVVANAASALRPNLLAEHLESLATAVGPFYRDCPVLKDGGRARGAGRPPGAGVRHRPGAEDRDVAARDQRRGPNVASGDDPRRRVIMRYDRAVRSAHPAQRARRAPVDSVASLLSSRSLDLRPASPLSLSLSLSLSLRHAGAHGHPARHAPRRAQAHRPLQHRPAPVQRGHGLGVRGAA